MPEKRYILNTVHHTAHDRSHLTGGCKTDLIKHRDEADSKAEAIAKHCDYEWFTCRYCMRRGWPSS